MTGVGNYTTCQTKKAILRKYSGGDLNLNYVRQKSNIGSRLHGNHQKTSNAVGRSASIKDSLLSRNLKRLSMDKLDNSLRDEG